MIIQDTFESYVDLLGEESYIEIEFQYDDNWQNYDSMDISVVGLSSVDAETGDPIDLTNLLKLHVHDFDSRLMRLCQDYLVESNNEQ